MNEQENEDIFEPSTIVERDNMLDEQAVLSAIGEDPNDVRWNINAYRIPKDGGKDVAIFRLNDPRGIATIVDKLMDYGTGEYRILVYRNGRLFRKLIYPIEVLEKKSKPETENSLSTLAASMTSAMERQTQTMLQMFERFSKPERQIAQIDPIEHLRGMSEIFANMNAGRTPIERNQSTSLIETLKLGIELGKETTGGGETKHGAMDLLYAFLEKGGLEAILKPQQQSSVPFPQPNTQRVAPPKPTPQQPEQRQPPQQNIDPMLAGQFQLLNFIMNKLCDFAVAHSKAVDTQDMTQLAKYDPGQIAPWLLDNIPPAVTEGLLQDPGILDKLAVNFPIVTERRGWFTALLQEIERLVSGPDVNANELSPDPGRNNGHQGNTQSDARFTSESET